VQALPLDPPFGTATVEIVGAVREVLVLPEIGQHIVQPSGIAELAPRDRSRGLARM